MSKVPCNTCTACCRQQIVRLTDEDLPNLPFYSWRQIGEFRVLNNKANGECFHLGPEGCSIYEQRPSVCRTYDCRKQFKILSPAERRRFAHSAMGDEARQRLGTLDSDDLADLADYRRRTTTPLEKPAPR